MAKAIKQKETFKVWKGLPKEVTITETTWNLFWRANHGNKRAVEQIVKRGLFDTWLQWNHELRTDMDVVVFLAECGLKPSSPDFEKTREQLIAKVGPEPSPEMYAALMEKVYA